jgi:hypothetical protein
MTRTKIKQKGIQYYKNIKINIKQKVFLVALLNKLQSELMIMHILLKVLLIHFNKQFYQEQQVSLNKLHVFKYKLILSMMQ